MNAPATTAESAPSTSRASPRPAALARAARLYGSGPRWRGPSRRPRRFLAELPEGAAVFQLGAPGVRFVLHRPAPRPTQPLLSGRAARRPPPSTPGTARCWPVPGWRTATPKGRRWCRASDGPAPPARALTARSIVWLDADAPRAPAYPEIAGHAGLARHVAPGDGRPDRRPSSRTAPRCAPSQRPRCSTQDGPQMLGKLSADLALRLAAALIHGDARPDSTAGNRSTKSTKPVPGARCSACATSPPSAGRRCSRSCGPARIACPACWRCWPRRRASPSRSGRPWTMPHSPLLERLKALCHLERLSLPRDRARRPVVGAGSPALHGDRRGERRTGRPAGALAALAHRRPRDAGRTAPSTPPWRRRSGPTGYMLDPLAARCAQGPGHLALLDLRRSRRHPAPAGDFRRRRAGRPADAGRHRLDPGHRHSRRPLFTLLVDMLLLLVAAALGSTGFQVARAMLADPTLARILDQQPAGGGVGPRGAAAHRLLPAVLGRRPRRTACWASTRSAAS